MVGYLISAAVYGLLLVACLTLRRRHLLGSGLAVALAIQVGWCAVLAENAHSGRVPSTLIVLVEFLRSVAWTLVLLRWLGNATDISAIRGVRRVLGAIVVVVLLCTAEAAAVEQPPALARFLVQNWLWGAFALSIIGLVLVEQVARNIRSAQHSRLKHIWLAIGAMYAWDLCLFSSTLLHGPTAPAFWAARGYINALIAPLLALGLSRIDRWEAAAFLSPRAMFFKATLLGAALYLFAMAAASTLVRQVGASWGAIGQILFLAAATLVLVVTVMSERFRAWARVALAQHMLPYRYDYRREWQKLTRALSETDETPVYERIVHTMAGFMGGTAGGLWLRDPDGSYLPVGGALAPPEAPREAACTEFFEFMLQREWIYDLDAVRESRRHRERLPQPPSWMLANARIWLIVPLICETVMVGFVAVGQPMTAVRFSWEEIDLLRAAGRQVASFLAFEQAAKRLAEAHQFEAMNRLSAILMHDLRHLVAQQALVVQNAQRHRGNPAFFDDAILTISDSVKRMTGLMDSLRTGMLIEQPHRTELSEACAQAVQRCASRHPVPTLHIHDRGAEVIANGERLLHVLEHLIRNAQDATPSDGSVRVTLRRAAPRAVIEVGDTGSGMDPEFIRSRLFRPFNTTKGKRGFGIGAYEAREFVRQCGGGVDVESMPGQGTRFIIKLPLAPTLGTAETLATHES
ncbi:MAG TPA: XrtA/PEP-CTERM system histidine kinase PrsK [Steroidobacteraceae bacterium]|nr:XrtA/PEP-CTERM system histidine kinase PrsK [Steroidobacteraceae bacterium]